MVFSFWGKKIGMTQTFSGDKVVPVTAINVANWVITQVKNEELDGYRALQIACLKKRYHGKEFSVDWLKKMKLYFGSVREIRLKVDGKEFKIGKQINFSDFFAAGDTVDVFGKSKGCGFAGVVKRHRFAGPPASHGHTMGKSTGSISFMATQGRVIKGKKMPGHMGNKQRVMKGLEIIKIDDKAHVVLVKGSVPGRPGTLTFMRKV